MIDYIDAAITVYLTFLFVILVIYGVRHYVFTFDRAINKQHSLYEGVNDAQWPKLTVFIAAHNEELVIDGCIEALVKSDYPRDRLEIIPVNDRSKDRTKEICDEWAAKYPSLVKPFHRTDGAAGKPAALFDASKLAKGDVIVIFDADYVPNKGLLKQIVSPFLDPEIGITMGRVVPYNVSTNLLTRMLDMERSAGYQGDQQARMNMALLPQYGGTVGGIRVQALKDAGGFTPGVLSEDTDLTFRMLQKGWKVGYINTAECYEEVPENWPVRIKQLRRWAKGHNEAMFKYLAPSIGNPFFTFRERLEAILTLCVYAVAPLTVLGWLMVLFAYFSGTTANYIDWGIPVLAMATYAGFGNAAAFFEMGTAIRLDGKASRIKMIPLIAVGYSVSAFIIFQGMTSLFMDKLLKRQATWDKTVRFRKDGHNSNAIK